MPENKALARDTHASTGTHYPSYSRRASLIGERPSEDARAHTDACPLGLTDAYSISCERSSGKRENSSVRTARGLLVGYKYCISCRPWRHCQGRRQRGHAAMCRRIPRKCASDMRTVSYAGPSRLRIRNNEPSVQTGARISRFDVRQVGDRGVHDPSLQVMVVIHTFARQTPTVEITRRARQCQCSTATSPAACRSQSLGLTMWTCSRTRLEATSLGRT